MPPPAPAVLVPCPNANGCTADAMTVALDTQVKQLKAAVGQAAPDSKQDQAAKSAITKIAKERNAVRHGPGGSGGHSGVHRGALTQVLDLLGRIVRTDVHRVLTAGWRTELHYVNQWVPGNLQPDPAPPYTVLQCVQTPCARHHLDALPPAYMHGHIRSITSWSSLALPLSLYMLVLLPPGAGPCVGGAERVAAGAGGAQAQVRRGSVTTKNPGGAGMRVTGCFTDV